MIHDPLVRHIVIAAALIVALAIIGRIVRTVVAVLSRRYMKRTSSQVDPATIDAIISRIFPLAIVVGFSLAIREIRKIPLPEDVTFHEILDYCSIAAFIAFVLLVSSLIGRFLKTSVLWYAQRVSARNRNNLAPAVVPFASKLINIVVFFIVGMIILDHLGVNIGGFLVSLGVGSLAVALAAQETIANMIAWFVILVDQPFRQGDVIRLPSGDDGKVTHIGLRSTRIVNADRNLVVIPNGELVKNRIINVTSPDISSRVVIDLPLAYGTDLERARSVMLAAASRRPELASPPDPQVVVMDFGDIGIMVRFQAGIADAMQRFNVETALREEFYAALRREGIEFPRAQRLVPLPERYATQTPQKK